MVNYFFKAKGDEKKWKPFWQKIFGLLILWSLPYALLLFTVLYFFVKKHIEGHFIFFVLLTILPVLFFDSVNMIGMRYYQSQQKPKYLFMVAVVTGIIAIFVNYYCIVHLKLHYWSFFITNFLIAFLNFLFFAYPLLFKLKLYPILGVKKNQLKNFLKISLPIIPHNYSAYLLNASDRVLLDLFKINPQQIGQYNFAYAMGSYAEAAGNALGLAVGPIYLNLYAKREQEFYQYAKYLTFFLQTIFIFFTFMICLWIKEIFNLLTNNSELLVAYPLAIVILMGYAYRPMYWACINRLGFEDRTGQFWKISFTGGLINVVLNLILIPFMGVMGSAIATFIGLLFIGFYGLYTSSFKGIDKQKYYPHVWLTLILITGSIAYFLRDTAVLHKIIINVIALCITAMYLYRNKKHFHFLIKQIT
ncbi:MAG: polysaccharide biosynthesis C-terminal domain-containing protein [Chitinophagaceae bacterium]|nr:polysaccharide biosynthesis C-terminal domain-containing protein [Chitinophagaceae bacterium]